MSTLPLSPGHYMIECIGWEGFVSVDNNDICICPKDSSKVQVWKLTDLGDGWMNLQGVSPKVEEDKFICIGDTFYFLVYGNEAKLHNFQLERLDTESQDTFRVAWVYNNVHLYWFTGGGCLALTDKSTSKWKFTKYSM